MSDIEELEEAFGTLQHIMTKYLGRLVIEFSAPIDVYAK